MSDRRADPSPRHAAWFAVPLAAMSAAYLGVPLRADPPPSPPPCNVIHDPVFCFRVTDIAPDLFDTDKVRFEFEVINWTGADVHGLGVRLNNGATDPAGGHVILGAPPFLVGASIDADGRPIDGPPVPITGNGPTANGWVVTAQTPTRVSFATGGSPPVPHPIAIVGGRTYHGIRDPHMNTATSAQCRDVLLQMIPGSIFGGGTGSVGDPMQVKIPDSETTDDGVNKLDGFVLTVDDLDGSEELSFDWFMLDAAGNPLGNFQAFLVPQSVGDPMGYGTFNLTRLPTAAGSSAPPPLFDTNTFVPGAVNAGYNPPDNTSASADSALLFAENEVSGIDTYPINPVPFTRPGGGTTFSVEPGASVTGTARSSADLVIGTVQPGTNLFENLAPPNDQCINGSLVSGFGPHSYDTRLCTTGTEGQNEFLCIAAGTAAIEADQWFRWTASCTGTATLTTCGLFGAGSGTDSKVAIYDGYSSSCPVSSAIACNDDSACGLPSTVMWNAYQGQVYLVQMGRYPGSPATFGAFTITESGGSCVSPFVAFCFGDGSGTACPCGNNGTSGNGCSNSVNASGANLSGSGNASISADSVVLAGIGMPNSSCLYFQGTTQLGGSSFGDGLRCAGGSVIRLGTKTNAGGSSSYPIGGDPSISVRGQVTVPGTRTYQAWYRNAASYCTSATFNLTNGLQISWGA